MSSNAYRLAIENAVALRPALSPTLLERIRVFSEREAAWQGRFLLDGKPPVPTDVRLDGNDYLSLTGHPHILGAQIDALRAQAQARDFVVQSGVFLSAQHPSRRLERRFAQYLGKDDVHLSQSGYMANQALLQMVCSAGEPTYLDMYAHKSLWEGVHAARTEPIVFRHNDAGHLRRLSARHGPGVVIIDSVYSGDGSIAPLEEFVQVCEETGCTLIVDESHSLGLYGPQGAGLVAALGLTDRIHFITASLAKAFAGRAGLFTAPASLRGFLYSQSFPSVFSSSLLPAEVAGLDATLDVILAADREREQLHRKAHQLRAVLARHGFPVSEGTEHIVALEAGQEHAVMLLRDAFERHGIIGAIFAAPAAAANRAFLRFTPHAALTDEELARIDTAAAQVAKEVNPQGWHAAHRERRRGG